MNLYLLLAGLLIAVISILFRMLGSLEKIESHTLFSNKAISLASGKPFPTLIARSFFRAEVSSRLLLEFKNVDGVLNAKVAECPLLPTPEPNAEYDFASLYEKRIGNPTETAEIKLRPTTYVIQLTPEMEKHVSATLKAALEERRKRFPSFYEVGVQLLVVAIPIIVTSFLT